MTSIHKCPVGQTCLQRGMYVTNATLSLLQKATQISSLWLWNLPWWHISSQHSRSHSNNHKLWSFVLHFHLLQFEISQTGFPAKCMKNAYSMLTKSCPRSSRTGTNNMTTHTSSQRLLGKSQTLIVLKNDRFELWLTPPAIHPLVTF